MGKIQWSDELGMGVKELDEQHRELIRIVNELIEAAAAKRGGAVIEDIVKQLREYSVVHFRAEEDFMASIDYPGRSAQVQAHADLKREVKEFQRRIYERTEISAREVLEFMKGWLLNHVLTYDRELAKFVAEQSVKAGAVTIGRK